MKRVPESWNIVLVGYWNRMVFQPNWGKAHFFPDDEVDVLLSTSDLDPIEYRGELVKMQVYSTKLVFRPRAPTNDESLLVAGVTALKTLKKLPETPVSGIGVNFAFIEEAAGAGLAKDIFDFPDDNPLQERGWEIEERTTSRTMMLQEQRLNFSTSCSEKKLVSISTSRP